MTRITKEPFGVTGDGRAVARFRLDNGSMTAYILDYGCTVQRIVVPDRDGAPVDAALGYDGIAGYEAGSCWLGAVVGRYAGRIGGAAFTLDGRRYELSENDGGNHLHGVFERRVFAAEERDGALILRYVSPAGEEGYPGTLDVTVAYRLTEDNALAIDYRAVTDAPTVLNLTNHTYFNLAGRGDILSHRLRLAASGVTELDGEGIPTGRILPVDGTAFDFRAEKPIGRDIGDAALRAFGGYDHNFVLDKGAGLALCGEAYCPDTGIELRFSTTQPGAQLYTGNFLANDAAPYGRGGARYGNYAGFALESQHFPNSPNIPAFPSAVLRPGEVYGETTEYRFGIRE